MVVNFTRAKRGMVHQFATRVRFPSDAQYFFKWFYFYEPQQRFINKNKWFTIVTEPAIINLASFFAEKENSPEAQETSQAKLVLTFNPAAVAAANGEEQINFIIGKWRGTAAGVYLGSQQRLILRRGGDEIKICRPGDLSKLLFIFNNNLSCAMLICVAENRKNAKPPSIHRQSER